MEKPTIVNDLILREGEAVIVNGIAINDKMIGHLMDFLTTDHLSKSVEAISSDLLYNKMHQIEHLEKDDDEYGEISESTTLLNMTLIGLLTEMGLLKNAYSEFILKKSDTKGNP